MAFLAVLFGIVFAGLAWAALNPLVRWRFRRIPGPFGLPLLGNLPHIASEDLTSYVLRISRKYGKVCKIWFGNVPWILINDPELVRKVAFKLLSRPSGDLHLMHMLSGEHREVDGHSLVFIRNGPYWRLARRAFESSIIRPQSLAAHMPAVQRCLASFLPRLAAASSSGEPLEVGAALGELALAAVGEVAYGVDFGTGKTSVGAQLISAIRDCFDSLEFTNATMYLPLKWMLPGLTPLWYWLAARLPDAAQRRHNVARQRLHDISRQLIALWQTGRAATAAAEQEGAAAAPEGGAAEDGAGKGASGGDALQQVGAGISSSSFMAAMLEGRQGARSGEERLSDLQVIAQCMTFLMAGSDTTSSTIAFTIFLLSSHPEAEARLLRELDQHSAAAAAGTEEVLRELPYLDAVLSESMRLYPAGSVLIREPPTDLDLGDGMVAPKGCALMLATYALHHDPALWPEPEAFRPERFLPESGGRLGPLHPGAYAPFGMGPRMCVGNKMATMLAKAALIEFYRRFTFRLHAKQVLPLRTRTAITFAPRDGVWVTVQARRGT